MRGRTVGPSIRSTEGRVDQSIAVIVGTLAGICSTGSFIPQVLKSWRAQDTEAISKRMYVVTVTAFTLWIVYGLMIKSMPIIIFNCASLVLSGTILALKLRNQRRERRALNGSGAGTAEAAN
jgi:MtN3 and saliva related transmembrane protein